MSIKITIVLFMTNAWIAYYSGIAGFSGTVFAITVAARTIGRHKERQESKRQNRTRYFESLAVIFELAAATVFSITAGVRGTIPASVIGTFIAGVGFSLYIAYCIAFLRKRDTADKHARLEWFTFAVAALPLISYAFVAVYFCNISAICFGPICVSASDLTDVWFPLSVMYLVMSGVIQTLVYYARNWKFA